MIDSLSSSDISIYGGNFFILLLIAFFSFYISLIITHYYSSITPSLLHHISFLFHHSGGSNTSDIGGGAAANRSKHFTTLAYSADGSCILAGAYVRSYVHMYICMCMYMWILSTHCTHVFQAFLLQFLDGLLL